MIMKGRILVVDDEEVVCRSCDRILSEGGHEVETTMESMGAVEQIGRKNYDVVILDIMMPKVSGLEILQAVKEEHPDIDVIM